MSNADRPLDWIDEQSRLIDQHNAKQAAAQATTSTSGDVTSLRSAIAYAEGSATSAERAAAQDEAAIAALQQGGTDGVAITSLQASMEQHITNAGHYRSAAADLTQQLAVTEAYEANQGAGTREFVTSE